MKIDHKIRDEKLQYDTNRESAKISELSLSKIYKYKYPSGTGLIIQQDKITYTTLGKACEKQAEK